VKSPSSEWSRCPTLGTLNPRRRYLRIRFTRPNHGVTLVRKIMGKSSKSKASQPELQRKACESIEENIYWHVGGISAISKQTGFPEVGTVTAVQWKNRTFLLTAGHVIDNYEDGDFNFVFRPPGNIERGLWWQSSTPGPLFPGEPINILRRYRSNRDDIAALEVSPNLESGRRLRFYSLNQDSKVVRPINSSFCAIGLPFDSFEHIGPRSAAFAMFSLWGNPVRPGNNIPDKFNPRTSLLMEFLPATDGRKPGGFSGAGVWYQTPTVNRPIVWSPAPILAGLITHYYPTRKALLICRVERLVSFLQTVTQ